MSMIRLIPLMLVLAGCGETAQTTEEPASEASAPAAPTSVPAAGVAVAAIDFGDDEGDWANDNECDDPRFQGEGMTATPLLDEDRGHDATDCRTAYEAGELQLKPGEE